MNQYLAVKKRHFLIVTAILMTALIALVMAFPTLAAGAWASASDSTYAHAEHNAVKLNDGRVLVEYETYDPATNTWTPTGPTNFAHLKGSTTLLADGRVLVAGNDGSIFYSPDSSDAEIYDPITDTWTPTGSMTIGRSGQLAVLLNDGRVLVAGNQWGSASAELYDPVTGVWTATGSMNDHHGHGTISLLPDGRALVVGGDTFDSVLGEITTSTAEIYDPATGTWQYTGSLSGPRRYHTATMLADGRILVAAGRDQNNAWLGSAEIYDPATGFWSLTGTMNHARYAHTATLLLNGQVLVTGMPNVPNVDLFSSELFDPATGLWSTTTNAPEERWSHTATLLDNGDVLVAGGIQTSDLSIGFYKVTAVLYTPDNNTPPPPTSTATPPPPTATPPPPTPTPPPSTPTTAHVSDLDGSSFWHNNRRWKATITIAVLDDLGNPVANAAVVGNWSGGISGSASCSTDGSGLCSVASRKIRKNKSSVTFTVSNISHAILSYDAAANSDPDGDSNGSAITVLKP